MKSFIVWRCHLFASLLVLSLTTVTSSAAPPSKVLFFGDSITQGDPVTPSQRWTALVTERSRGGFVEINEGKGGRPASAVGEFAAVLAKYRDDTAVALLVIAVGANDARDTTPDCAAKTAAHLARMIALAREGAPRWRILVCAPSNIRPDALGATRAIGPARAKNLVDIGRAFEGVAARERCAFMSFLGVVPEESLAADGVHPDPAGHTKLADVAWPVLERCLREPAPTPPPPPPNHP